ncbi:hypothetical protein DPMN_071336 [Dreissena polymorpha]|uniref:Uncharacterized protein n=1 Tax=Dreissena polymorpha TaxID=45954 RepID=A0A9D4BW58_DREPO|nr:hypothetical protein DPMN_071336 [Dreissena polymorpha]
MIGKLSAAAKWISKFRHSGPAVLKPPGEMPDIEKNFPAHWRPCFFTDLDHFRTRLIY